MNGNKILRKSLNEAFLKLQPLRKEIDNFKKSLAHFLKEIKISNESREQERHFNVPIIKFLNSIHYESDYCINTHYNKDLVIHNGGNSNYSIGVIIEAKRPSNKAEMVKKDNINTTALQELLLYYLRERISNKNLELKNLIITNFYEWYVFDAQTFEKVFASDKRLTENYEDFESKRLTGTKTKFFYDNIAKPAIEEVKDEIEFVYFDIREYEELIGSKDREKEKELIPLFKILSPEYLLKLPFSNDSNTLDEQFYSELLYIIGLVETKKGSKKLIQRENKDKRKRGSLIENTIYHLEIMRKIRRLKNPNRYGENHSERVFNVALELTITWINRVLFLKLLEAQLIAYHKNDETYSFLKPEKILNYDDLNDLFFGVLARKSEERDSEIERQFSSIPFLNSSLFEPTELEQETIFISNLNSNKTLPISKNTVLKNPDGKKRKGSINALKYLFNFLNSYDFTSENAEDIQEENKSLIKASVLGLIFEKINGYKDGSYFTPGFITMYMCREAIRKVVVQKFNDFAPQKLKTELNTLSDIYNHIGDNRLFTTEQADDIINSLKVCDPAVGSGHFLVSALNEIIAIKAELGLLRDEKGKSLKDYKVEVVNDELIITDEDGRLFEYNPSPLLKRDITDFESQRVQKTVFSEKRKIIENCLFGVDINPNSVKICRLRLWIELLKHTYYKSDKKLETMPNIDINIKCGDSLVSKYGFTDAIPRKDKPTLERYKLAVKAYKSVTDRNDKFELKETIENIRKKFQGFWTPENKEANRLAEELHKLNTENNMFVGYKEKLRLEKRKKDLERKIEEIQNKFEKNIESKINNNAFEWRFEFPEILGEDGNFLGFDVVIGNPPYGVKYKEKFKNHFKKYYESVVTKETNENGEEINSKGSLDTFSLFIDRSLQLVNNNSFLSLIVPMAFTSSDSMYPLHKIIFKKCESIWVSTYFERPKKIFDNSEISVTILNALFNKKENKRIYTTKIIKRYKNSPISDIINSLEFVNSKNFYKKGRIPKVGKSIELGILEKIESSKHHLSDFILKDESRQNESNSIYYRFAGGRYYKIITNYSTNSSAERCFHVDKIDRDALCGLLSSNLIYWYYHIHCNYPNWKNSEIEMIPIPELTDSVKNELKALYQDYIKDLNNNSKIIEANYSNINSYKQYYARKSKHIIDKIDLAIQDAYGLSDEEIDFIINYDLKFRTDQE